MNEQAKQYDAGEDIVQQYTGESAERLLQLCANWINTAAQHARNEDYWRERALKAEGKTQAEIADWGH